MKQLLLWLQQSDRTCFRTNSYHLQLCGPHRINVIDQVGDICLWSWNEIKLNISEDIVIHKPGLSDLSVKETHREKMTCMTVMTTYMSTEMNKKVFESRQEHTMLSSLYKQYKLSNDDSFDQ